jgi:hypothetical protein
MNFHLFFLVVALKVKNKALENEFSVTEGNEEPTYCKKNRYLTWLWLSNICQAIPVQ